MSELTIESISDELRKHDVSPSYPRKRILEYLIQRHNHPTVNTIYDDLIDEIPSLSKTTIYNNLRLFVEKKLVEEITIEGNEKRYDLYNPESHAHFRCISCGKLYDIRLDYADPFNELKDFQIHNLSIHLNGVCPDCINTASAAETNSTSRT